MLISRAVPMLKNIVTKVVPKRTTQHVIPSRNSGSFHYREVPEAPKVDTVVSNLMGGLMWWWILWHLWHDFGHIVGEFEYPDPSQWTDEELGIPPDDD